MRKQVKRLDSRVFEEFKSICEDYAIHSSEDNLNALLEIYERLKPNWVEEFNELSEEIISENKIQDKTFDNFLRVQLPKGYTIEKLKASKNEKQDPFIDIMQRGRIIHIANKIAHHFEEILDERLSEYMIKNGIRSRGKTEFYQIKKRINQIYNPNTKDRIKDIAKSDLILYYGFEERDFEIGRNLDVLNFPQLVKARNDGMYMKDTEIENVNQLIHDYDRDDISYGIKKVSEDHNLFVMDIQGFGQFSVHIKYPNLISQIRTQYKMPIYRAKTKMLVNQMSKEATEFIEEVKEDDSMDEERNIPKHASEFRKQRARLLEEIKFLDLTKAEKHELGVKGGLTRKELQELDDAKEERW